MKSLALNTPGSNPYKLKLHQHLYNAFFFSPEYFTTVNAENSAETELV